MSQTFYQVAPRYTAGSPAQVDEATALRVAAQEQDAGSGDNLDGIAERVTDFADRRVIEDLITGRRRELPIRQGRVVEFVPDAPRIQPVQPTAADTLKADLRALQDVANRRGGAWLIKWALLFQGVKPGQITLEIQAAERTGDPAYLDYVKNFPWGHDPRD